MTYPQDLAKRPRGVFFCNGKSGYEGMDKLHEECGVIGIYNKDENAVWSVWEGLFALQHRGQESAGIAVYSDNTIHCERGMGLVNEALCSETVKRLPSSRLGIGHVRYSTAGESSANNVQPMFARFSGGWIAIAHNGNLINTEALEQQLLDEGEYFQTSSDSGVLMALIIRNARNVSIEESIMHTMRDMVKGSYALVITTQDKLIGVRDPLGIRPLVLGRTRDGGWCLASESCAIDIIGAELVRDIAPGEMVVIDREGIKEHKFADTKKSALCVFEHVYIARPDSVIDGLSVYKARYEMGRQLARTAPADADFVAGVPESALPAAKGYAAQSGLPYSDALVRNRFVGRTFIQPTQSMREQGVYLKLSALNKTVEGKSIVLVDDSIVRGTTSKKIVTMLKNAGAKAVHLRIASPPVRFPCRYGVDTPTSEELAGACYSIEYIRDMVGADSLEYITLDGLREAVKDSNLSMCSACFDGDYPLR